ncbi:lysosomal Pro-X carboxypeptidase-like [Tigriopus californicus]|uniref:lysosomal Pro-X carboxypeptidase-like n=1 Tax=Tigriopus californicus TaxID=6832 RepID=UPI0027DA6A9E|nr:lysosomal Pro-X carboxypeptidase-like [Tigriopus californicus]
MSVVLATFLVVVCLFGSCFSLKYHSPSEKTYSYETKYFDQRIDHFSLTTDGFFKQKYLINDTYWDRRSGPIFFYTGNEGDIEAFAQNSGFMWDIAPQFRALLIFAEHRYYGESLPFGKDSTKPDPSKNGYLTSEQALADFAYLIQSLKKENPSYAKSAVIAFGGSYGGMLAAWFRIKFPHICDGAIAASAPVAQFDAPCNAFGRIVTADYALQGKGCANTIRDSWDIITNMSATDDGLKWMSEQFRFCKPLTKNDVTAFKGYLNELWTNVAMMDYPYSTTFLMPLPGNPVKQICKSMMYADTFAENDTRKINLKQIFAGASVYFNHTGDAKCFDMGTADDIGSSMWDYQACTEMVMPFCFDGKADMFEKADWNYTAFAETCKNKWKVTPRPQMANLMYGEKKLHGASNIIFSNGLLDPWASGGILKSISRSVVSIIIPRGAHHLDLRASHPDDPQGVIKARNIEKKYINQWITQADRDKDEDNQAWGPDDKSIIVG